MLSDSDRVSIDALRERLRKSIVDGNAEAYRACFSEDAFLLHPESSYLQGRGAISEYVSQMFEAVRVPRLELTPLSVVGSGDLAFEVGIQVCEVEPPMPGFKRERQHLHVYQRTDDDRWHVVAAMSGNQ